MMKKIVISFLSAMMLVSCNAQTEKKKDEIQDQNNIEKIQPKVDYKVNKEYDENGNLIRLDSTYTYYYSNIDKNKINTDSIFKSFNQHFSMNSTFDDSFFEDFFKQDQYSKDEFFSQDFFRSDAKRSQDIMNEMMARMDSIKNEFMMNQFPIIPEIEEEKNQ